MSEQRLLLFICTWCGAFGSYNKRIQSSEEHGKHDFTNLRHCRRPPTTNFSLVFPFTCRVRRTADITRNRVHVASTWTQQQT